MLDLLLEGILAVVLLAIFVYPFGFAVMVWYPFYDAFRQDKMVTEIYGITGVFTNMGRAVIWPYYAWKNLKNIG